MPLKAYRDESSRLRRSTPQIHYATELVLTPQQAHQIQQSLVNRYATIGRNYHINVGCDQTAVKADVHYRHQQPPQPQPPKPYRSGDNLAMRINNNLISQPSMVMNERSHHHHHHHEAPLTDVRKLQEVSTPPTLSMTSKLNTVPLSSSEDILSADSTTECCDEDGRLSPDDDPEVPKEEEEVRKHTLLSTLVMPRPQRKPPFTIEAAMNKLLGRSKKNASPDASPKLKPSNNGSRRKSSPVAPKKQQQPLPAVNTRDGKSSGGSSCSSSSMVTTLRRAGSDREPPSHFQRGSEDLSDEEATVPDSDSEVMKKPPPPVPSSVRKRHSCVLRAFEKFSYHHFFRYPPSPTVAMGPSKARRPAAAPVLYGKGLAEVIDEESDPWAARTMTRTTKRTRQSTRWSTVIPATVTANAALTWWPPYFACHCCSISQGEENAVCISLNCFLFPVTHTHLYKSLCIKSLLLFVVALL